MRLLKFKQVDVFTRVPFSGNPVAVVLEALGLSDEDMQRVAAWTNLSETTFVLPPSSAAADYRLRIFTPRAELPFAGHPTLGSAFVLGGPLQKIVLRLETGRGIVPVELEREGARISFGWMEQPLPSWEPFEQADQLLAALGVERAILPVELYDLGIRHVLVGLGSPEEVAALSPDFAELGRLVPGGTICFAAANGGWKVRSFVPALGVREDPATGSAAGPLAVHLARHGQAGFGEEIEIAQGVEIGRPSTLYARADGSAERLERVQVGGSAVIVARGEFSIP